MNLFNLIEKYIEDISQTKTLNDDEIYSKLVFALQLPSICGRIDYKRTDDIENLLYTSSGRPKDKSIFTKWITEKCKEFSNYVNPENMTLMINSLYDLRCMLTHEGVIDNQKGKEFKIYFIEEGKTPIIASGYMFISPIKICTIIFNEALKTLTNKDYEICQFPSMCINSNLYDKIFNTISENWSNHWEERPESKRIYDECQKSKIDLFKLQSILDEIKNCEDDNKNKIEQIIENYQLDNNRFFLKRKKKNEGEIIALMETNGAEYKLLPGSQVSKNYKSITNKKVLKLRETAKIENGILKEEIVFDSPSAAAEFCIGTNSNGYNTWKDKNGKFLERIK